MISIIIPVYNSILTIDNCIQSVIRQTYTDWEAILIDDGSNDNSIKICNEYMRFDHRIKVFSQDNMGVSSARNNGIRHSKGKYILFLDSDDEIPVDFCEKIIKIREEYNNQYMIITAVIRQQGDEISGYRRLSDEGITIIDESEFVQFLPTLLFHSVWNQLYNRKIIIDNEITFDKNINFGEDFLFNIKYAKALGVLKVVVINDVYYRYKLYSQNSLSQKYNPNLYEYNKIIYNELYELCSRLSLKKSDKIVLQEMFWAAIVNALKTNMEQKDIKFSERLRQNKYILKDPVFKIILSKQKERLRFLSYLSYKLEFYFLIYIKDCLK